MEGAKERALHYAVAVELGYACNLDCSYCYAKRELAGKGERIPLSTQLKVVERFIEIYDSRGKNYVLTVKISGGEPTLYSDEVDATLAFVRDLSDERVAPMIHTNAVQMLSDRTLNTLADAVGSVVVTPHALWITKNSRMQEKVLHNVREYATKAAQMGFSLHFNVLVRGAEVSYGSIVSALADVVFGTADPLDYDTHTLDVTHDTYLFARDPLALWKNTENAYSVLLRRVREHVNVVDDALAKLRRVKMFLDAYCRGDLFVLCDPSYFGSTVSISKFGSVFVCPFLLPLFSWPSAADIMQKGGDALPPGGYVFPREQMESILRKSVALAQSVAPGTPVHICPYVAELRGGKIAREHALFYRKLLSTFVRAFPEVGGERNADG